MGMFDYVRCQYPLPVEGANALDYQSKDTPAQLLETYEIRGDGRLWHYPRPVLCDLTGEIRFCSRLKVPDGKKGIDGFIEFVAYFEKGKVILLNLIENDRPVIETTPPVSLVQKLLKLFRA